MSPITSGFQAVGLAGAENSGRAAVNTGAQLLNQDAQVLSNPDNPDLASPLVGATQSLLLTKAGAAVLETADKMTGTLLDVYA